MLLQQLLSWFRSHGFDVHFSHGEQLQLKWSNRKIWLFAIFEHFKKNIMCLENDGVRPRETFYGFIILLFQLLVDLFKLFDLCGLCRWSFFSSLNLLKFFLQSGFLGIQLLIFGFQLLDLLLVRFNPSYSLLDFSPLPFVPSFFTLNGSGRDGMWFVLDLPTKFSFPIDTLFQSSFGRMFTGSYKFCL